VGPVKYLVTTMWRFVEFNFYLIQSVQRHFQQMVFKSLLTKACMQLFHLIIKLLVMVATIH